MDAVEIVKKISSHYLVTHDMPLQIQLGFPYLEKKNGMLYMSFKAHKEVYRTGSIEFYMPQFELVLSFPFEHVISFRMLENESNKPAEVVVTVTEKQMLSTGQYLIKELYNSCSRALTFWEETGSVSDLIIAKYQEQYKETVNALNLQEVYL